MPGEEADDHVFAVATTDKVHRRHGQGDVAYGQEGSVAKSGYLVTCLRDLPRGVEA